ncbi:MAG: hypothetical protein L3K07_01625 [Thermoplasmata archaeon]|nr:hypothetical protein [Thermoplasmata archaeon]
MSRPEQGHAALAVDAGAYPERVGTALALAATEVARRVPPVPLLVEEREGPPGWELRVVGASGLVLLVGNALDEAGVSHHPVPAGPAHLPPESFVCTEYGVLEPRLEDPAVPGASDEASQRTTSAPRPEAGLAPSPVPLAGYRPGVEGLWFALQEHLRSDGNGGLELWVRILAASEEGPAGPIERAAPELTARGSLQGLAAAGLRTVRPGWAVRREWSTAAVNRFRSAVPFEVDPELAGRLLAAGVPGPPDAGEAARHTICFGASGSGKSAYLAELARSRLRAGKPMVLLDVHGTLGPELLAGLEPAERRRVSAIDPTAAGPIAGLELLRPAEGDRGETERAQLLSAFRRIGAHDGATYWGFRIDRVLESFLALTQESGGDLRELAGLLTDPARRELARRLTRTPALAAFLDELPALLRRNPEFLWPATARLGRLLLSPRLLACVAPRGHGLDVPALLAAGRSLVLRLPIGELGPEAAELVGTLLLTRIYLDLTRPGRDRSAGDPPVLLLLDEAQRLSPHLLAEMLAEGRKFGLSVVAATQYPERLDPEARAAAAGAASRHLLFRAPRAIARETGRWAGLEPSVAETLLPSLPPGSCVEAVVGPRAPRRLRSVPIPQPIEPGAWEEVLRRSAVEAGISVDAEVEAPDEDALRLTLLTLPGPSEPGTENPFASGETALLEELRRRGLASTGTAGARLTPRGELAAEVLARTGAVRESETHRRLLLRAARIFARRGFLLELPRQGSFDRQVPDGRFRQLGELPPSTPVELAVALDRARGSWAWRSFAGRDVHLEAEVSGALRPERIRHGLRKARANGAFALFLVPDAARARRVRTVLRAAGVGREEAAVWTLVERPAEDG